MHERRQINQPGGRMGGVMAVLMLLAACASAPHDTPESGAPVIEASAPAGEVTMDSTVADSTEVALPNGVTDNGDPASNLPEADDKPGAAAQDSPEPESEPSAPALTSPPEEKAAPALPPAKASTEPSPATAPRPQPKDVASESGPAKSPAQDSVTPAATPATKPAEPGPAADTASAPAPRETMNLDGLESRLRQTKAIGLFTKLELKSQVEDLLKDMENYHRSRSSMTLTQLEEHFNLLVMKLLVLLEKDDPKLHRDIARARPALWTTLADPVQFSTMKGP